MELFFYPYDYQYKIRDGKVLVHLYSKSIDGQKICVVIEHQPYFYVAIKTAIKAAITPERLRNVKISMNKQTGWITHWEEVEKELLGKRESFLKIYTNIPTAVPPISKELESWGMTCYEKDILFVQRFIRDSGVVPLAMAQAEGEFINEGWLRVPVFLASSVQRRLHDSTDHLNILSVDIETYAKERGVNHQNPILMIAVSGEDGSSGNSFKKVLTWKQFSHKLEYVEILPDEAEMIRRFREIVLHYKPDVLAGYFSDGFDFPYLKARAEKFRIRLDIGDDYTDMEIGSKDARIRGILHIDVFKFVRNIFGKTLKTESYRLDEVSYELLGHRKHDVDIGNLYAAWDHDHHLLEEYCAYNMRDADLTLQLCQKLLVDMREFSQICGLPLFDMMRMGFSRLIESYIMKRAMEFDILSPNRPGHMESAQRMEETYEGAFVYEPTPGLYDDLVIFDFRSLYPSIITSHNIGPEGFHCICCQDKAEARVPGFDDYWFCIKEKGFLPTILVDIIEKRAQLNMAIRKLKEEQNSTSQVLASRSFALKILANSFYGYLAYFSARWYCLPCARSTTAYARNYIKETIKKAEGDGFTVVYGDTDSMFLLLGKKTIADAKELMNHINLSLPGFMELEFEGYFPKGIFVALKGREQGAKKKYALLADDGKLKITGFETIRRNWSPLAKQLQEKVLRLVLSGRIKEAVTETRQLVDDLKQGRVPKDDLIIRTKITRELSSYTSIGPHVAVAKRMIGRGMIVSPGTIVEYIIVAGHGLIRDRAKLVTEVEGGYDAEYYLNNQLIPAVSSIFSVVGFTEDEIFSESKQKGLGEFSV